MKNNNIKSLIKFSVLAFLFCLKQNLVEGQQFYKIPEQIFDLYEMTGYDSEFIDTVPAFEVSQFISLKEYKEFLEEVKRDSTHEFYLKMLPDSSISHNSIIYKEYITDKKYEKYPVLGVTWESAMYYCYWKTKKDFANSKDSCYYRLPLASEWLAAYKYLESYSIKNDFNYKYADLLITSLDETGYSFIDHNEKYGFLFDHVFFHRKHDSPALKRKRIIGSSYVFEMNKFMTSGACLYAEEGSNYVSFRIVKAIKMGNHNDSLGVFFKN